MASFDVQATVQATAIPMGTPVDLKVQQPVRSQQSVEILMSPSEEILPPEPKGRFRDNLCECCNDLPSCCCLFWLPHFSFILIGQLAERVVAKKAYPSVVAFYFLTLLLVCICIGVGYGDLDCEPYDDHYDDEGDDDVGTHESSGSTSGTHCHPNTAAVSASRFFIAVFGFAMFVLVCQIRQTTRRIYGIQSSSCGECEDCCCAYWCMPCTICQLWRHVQDPAISGAQGCCSCFTTDGLPQVRPLVANPLPFRTHSGSNDVDARFARSQVFSDVKKKEVWYGIENQRNLNVV